LFQSQNACVISGDRLGIFKLAGIVEVHRGAGKIACGYVRTVAAVSDRFEFALTGKDSE
jgi:hypothetical protein